ncbi:MAG: polyprenyl synthetase family protein [Aeromicrobium sp.]
MPSHDETTSAEMAFRQNLDGAIDTFVQTRLESFEPLGPDVLDFVGAAAQFVSGGKRLRASFCRAGWLAAGGADGDDQMTDAAAAIELLQGSALVHDDLMDGSDTRRGRPSVHRDFAARHRARHRVGDPAWYGQSTAILMGDLLLSWSNEMLVAAALRAEPSAARSAIAVFDACKAEVAAGQFLDVTAQTRPDVSVADAMVVVRYKSAKYTVERPLQIGAALAGADATMLGRLSDVALPLGEAFQLRDDVLGVFGDPEVTGKPAGDDLREGKRTVLVARTLELTDAAGRATVINGLGTEAVDDVQAVIRSSGALAAVEADIARLEAEADAAIDALGARDVLGPLALRATRRDR